MKKLLPLIVLMLSCICPVLSAQIVFTKSELTRHGFEQAIGRASKQVRGWWELYQRDICVINPDGTGLKQLTNNGVSYSPRWSPDGKKIAYCSGPEPTVSLWMMDPNGENKVELLSNQEAILDFRWSPDSSKILVYLKGKSTREPEECLTVDVKTLNIERMGKSEWARGWNHWASTGAEILNPNKRLLSGLPQGISWPEWSPDGNYIAFIYEGRLAIANALTTGMPDRWRATRAEPPCDKIGFWSWSPDGNKILFLAGGNVCSVKVDGTDVRNLSMSHADSACWSPDGTKIAFTGNDGRKRNTEIFIMDSDGTNQIQITNTNYYHSELHWR